jgi:hypothetical protein
MSAQMIKWLEILWIAIVIIFMISCVLFLLPAVIDP